MSIVQDALKLGHKVREFKAKHGFAQTVKALAGILQALAQEED